MNAQELTHYLADQPPSVVQLEIEKHFEALNDKQKRYAHFISKYVATLKAVGSHEHFRDAQTC